MPLSGTFDVLDFAEVVKLLARQGVTGRLHVRSRHYGANLFFDDGSLVGADQSEHQAAAASGDVRGRLEEICFELLDVDRGTFEFQPGRAGGATATRLKVDPVLTRARKRLEEWRELQAAIPSLDVQPHLVDDLNSAEVTIDQERWRVLTSVDGRRNLRAIGRALGMSDFDVCRVIKGLLDDGVVELDLRAAGITAPQAREAGGGGGARGDESTGAGEAAPTGEDAPGGDDGTAATPAPEAVEGDAEAAPKVEGRRVVRIRSRTPKS